MGGFPIGTVRCFIPHPIQRSIQSNESIHPAYTSTTVQYSSVYGLWDSLQGWGGSPNHTQRSNLMLPRVRSLSNIIIIWSSYDENKVEQEALSSGQIWCPLPLTHGPSCPLPHVQMINGTELLKGSHKVAKISQKFQKNLKCPVCGFFFQTKHTFPKGSWQHKCIKRFKNPKLSKAVMNYSFMPRV